MNRPSFRSLCLAVALIAGACSGAHAAPDYDALITLGNAFLQAGNADQALKSGQAAIKTSADRWEGYALAGSALMNLKRYEPAADALSKTMSLRGPVSVPSRMEVRVAAFSAGPPPRNADTSA